MSGKQTLFLSIGFMVGALLGGPNDFAWMDSTFPEGGYRLPELNDGYGVIFRDFNGDHYPDIYLVRFRNLNRLFLNDPENRTFRDWTIKSGLGGNLYPGGRTNLELSASLVDVDNDGTTEILITGWGATTDLLVRNRPLHFRSGFKGWKPDRPIDGNMGLWADVDLDGDLDLFVTDEHHANHLFIQSDKHRLQDRTQAWGVTGGRSVSQGAAFGDLNRDGWPDLYVCNWFTADSLYLNQQGLGFKAISLPLKHLQNELNSNSVTMADLDQDGRLDLIVCDRNGQSAVYQNTTDDEGLLRFEDRTDTWGIQNPYPAYGAVAGDLNRDGFPEILFTNLGPNQLYSRQADGRFRLAWEEPTETGHYSTGAAFADLDRDGDLDVLIANKDTTCRLIPNRVKGGHWLAVELDGIRSNREAIGAQVLVQDSARQTILGFQVASSGMGYLSQSDPVLYFGLGEANTVWVTVRYPSGIVRERQVRTDQAVVIPEVAGWERTAILGLRAMDLRMADPQFWINLVRLLLAVSFLTGFLWLAGTRYRWTARPMMITFGVLVVLLYLVIGLIGAPTAEKILKTVLNGEILALGILTVILEQVHRLNRRRERVRQTLQRFSEDLTTLHDNQELARQLVTVCWEQLHLERCALWLKNESSYELEAVKGMDPQDLVSLSLDEVQRLAKGDGSIGQPPFETVLILKHKSSVEGVWGLTGRSDRNWKLDREDLALLQILAETAALAIQNNRYIVQVTEQERRLAQQEIREKMIAELEAKNNELERLYRELKETQAQLVHQEKMSSLGQLVAGIAHELNNPLSFMYSNLKTLDTWIQQAKSGEALPEEAGSIVAEIMEGSVRIRDLVRDLRNFSRMDEAQFKIANIHEGLDSTLMLLRGEFKHRITVHKEYGDIPDIRCLPGHLNQVFLNLLLNASQAIDGPGDIWIRTWRDEDNIYIQIRDNGSGIPEDVRDRLFEPFVTTKPVGEGMGLGLSISYGIVARHGGTIQAENWDEGSQFTMQIPLEPKPGENE